MGKIHNEDQDPTQDKPKDEAETGFIRIFPKCPFCHNNARVGESDADFVFLFMNQFHCSSCNRDFA